jgi:hypothetical protein
MALHAARRGEQIYHIKTPTFPQFRFEWHPGARRVYLIRVGAAPVIGEAMAFEVKTHGDAQNAVLIWLRGYRQRSLEMQEPTALLQLT